MLLNIFQIYTPKHISDIIIIIIIIIIIKNQPTDKAQRPVG